MALFHVSGVPHSVQEQNRVPTGPKVFQAVHWSGKVKNKIRLGVIMIDSQKILRLITSGRRRSLLDIG